MSDANPQISVLRVVERTDDNAQASWPDVVGNTDEDVDGTRTRFRGLEAGQCHVEANEGSEDQDPENVHAEVGHSSFVDAENVLSSRGIFEKLDSCVQKKVEEKAEHFQVDI